MASHLPRIERSAPFATAETRWHAEGVPRKGQRGRCAHKRGAQSERIRTVRDAVRSSRWATLAHAGAGTRQRHNFCIGLKTCALRASLPSLGAGLPTPPNQDRARRQGLPSGLVRAPKAKRLMVTLPLQTLDEYRRLCASFRLEVPEHFNFGNDVFDRWASQRPDDRAMLWNDDEGNQQSLTFRELADRSNQVANGMVALGLQRGDQILLELPSVVAWWELMLGLTKADMIPVPGTTLLTEKDIAYRVQAAEIDAVVTDVAGAERVDHVATELSGLKFKILVGEGDRPGWIRYEELVRAASTEWEPIRTRSDGPALMYFTSGTTGLPKMVLHTHASYGIGHNLTARFWLGLQTDDLHWNISDTGWAKTAYSGFFGPWIAGSAIYVHHHAGKFDAARVLTCLSTHPISSLCAPPTVYRMLVQQDLTAFRPLALRRCMAAGEPLNVTVLKRWQQATGLTIREGYGQTETVILWRKHPAVAGQTGVDGLAATGHTISRPWRRRHASASGKARRDRRSRRSRSSCRSVPGILARGSGNGQVLS